MKHGFDIAVKEIFFYNNRLEREMKGQNIKKIISFLVLIIIEFILCQLIWKQNLFNIFSILGILFFILAVIIFLRLICYIFILFVDLLDHSYSGNSYVITKDNKFYSLKLKINHYSSNNSIATDKLKQHQKISSNYLETLTEDDIFSSEEIMNVHNIKEYKNRIEFHCDCLDLDGNFYKNRRCSIYKYYDEYDKIIDFFKNRLTPVDTTVYKKNNTIHYTQLNLSQISKIGYYLPLLIFVMDFIKQKKFDFEILYFSLCIGISFILIIMFLNKKNYQEIESIELKQKVHNHMILDRFVFTIYVIIMISCLIICYKDFVAMIVMGLVIFGFTFFRFFEIEGT